MKKYQLKRSIGVQGISNVPEDHRFATYEVSPTVPGPLDRKRDADISKAIAEWISQHGVVKAQ